MPKTTLNWDYVRSYLAVLEHNNLSAAARALGISQPTLGRHIDALEDSFGAPLFIRSQRGLTPTELGIAIQPQAEAMQLDAQAMLRSVNLKGSETGGIVKLSTSEYLGTSILPKLIAGFIEKEPDITVELEVTNKSVDLSRNEADIAIRTARPTQLALVARKITDSPIKVYAHKDYVARAGTPETLNDIYDFAVIGSGSDLNPMERNAMNRLGMEPRSSLFRLRTPSPAAQIALIEAGAGIGVIQKLIAIQNPDLVAVLPDLTVDILELWLVMHESRAQARPVRKLFDYIGDELQILSRQAGLTA